mgnify:FL=1|jgi:hypothetical protein
MTNLLHYLFLFIFVFSILGLVRLLINFIKSVSSTPPVPFEQTTTELFLNGGFVAYIITFITYLVS